jgi:Mg2+ and Co2+ transporter CorA
LKVSNLLSQIENEWNHKREEMHRETSDYQTEMLENQELIAQRTMRDSTVMKVIAILTALFLPGTFIAVRPRHPSLCLNRLC